jgi:hypothetical protein
MNERIKELAEQAGLDIDDSLAVEPEPTYYGTQSDFEKFAELVRADEREACAKLCEQMAHPESSSDLAWAARSCAAAIRARGEK